jgi:hypothetical protein
VLSDFASPLGVAIKLLWISSAFKPYGLKCIVIDCWSIEITDRNGSILMSWQVKTDVMLIVY